MKPLMLMFIVLRYEEMKALPPMTLIHAHNGHTVPFTFGSHEVWENICKQFYALRVWFR